MNYKQKHICTVFYIYLCSTLYMCPLFLLVGLSYCLASFHFSLKDPLQYFLEGKFPSDKFSLILFIHTFWECVNFFIFEGQCLDIEVFIESLFLQYLNVTPLFSPSIALAVNLTDKYVISGFSLDTFKILSLSLAFSRLIIMGLSVGFFECISLGVLSFLDVQIVFH